MCKGGAEMTLTTDKARWSVDGDGFWVSFRVNEETRAKKLVAEMDKPNSIEVKPVQKKRSPNSNAYLWALLDKLAAVLDTTKEELYLGYVRRGGPFRDFTLTEAEAKTFRHAWGMIGTGWPTEQVDYAPDGERVVIRAYYGSSTYNNKQMSRLLNAVVDDCKGQGIETMTPCELALLKEAWDA